ncbi:hypothetical protein IFM89_025293, partial [Coptis chinensis]
NVLNGTWEKVASLKHGGRFSREAVEAVGWRGKLCVVNVKGNVVKEGVVYDVEKDTWQEMAEGMLIGWNGPTAQVMEQTTDAEKAMDASQFLDYKRKNKDCRRLIPCFDESVQATAAGILPGERTFAVLTKLDLMDKGTNAVD